MIYVDRHTVEAPSSLSSANGAAQKELERARKYYRRVVDKAFPFEAYKNDDVVEKLEDLFHGKCAYCEHRYAAGAKVDVEHYRPKGGVKEEPDHTGYWWLALDWDNLLPSCIDCNRSRYHEIQPGGPEFDDRTTPWEILSGKGNAFPIKGAARAQRPQDDLNAEDPLLINPTVRDPSVHLKWATHDRRSIVAAQWLEAENAPDPYGEASIRAFGLNRPALVEDRTEVLRGLMARAQLLERKIARTSTKIGIDLEEALEEIVAELVLLRDEGKSHRRYSAVANTFLEEFTGKIGTNLSTLLAQLDVAATGEQRGAV
ncbi:HNH endonuclease family protein [Dyella flagellata]|uniref:TIGR02646 family protein n=1 Tax=Dyella flagellata TaxID=1867833 RepID=A0ABQ5X7T5_9GAMM|nr:hypothetical protein [Dyella flagellata]GLQ87697.1 hypothetical protein GCM10007898_12640 [Dyella flagellata]